jgi:hypothetical protein
MTLTETSAKARLYISHSTGCWIDLYEHPRFQGRHVRLFGPGDFVNLRVRAEGWSHEVRSVVLGPGAYAQCFAEMYFDASVIWLVPDQRVADVALLPTEQGLDSLRLFDRPPFMAEPGFEAYVKAHGDPPPLLKLGRGEDA